jgi:hypothetical protein
MYPGLNCIIIYSDLVDTRQVIADVHAPLLRVLAMIRAKHRGDMPPFSLEPLQYQEIIKKDVSSITISLHDDLGRRIAFSNIGRVAAVLHIRKRDGT